MNKNYLVIQNNVVTNICMWDGNTSTWTPPQNAIMRVQETTPAVVWIWNESKNDSELQEKIGAAAIGFTWDGSKCVTNQPKPTV